ncbi:hypothetical protein M514_02240 [Trichuris suis]|uniref:Uncharacterized protein n=1 Tax=Trichuris suis TaxID=68888 RepID=A0A085MID7_9BILA|nr:hypothetical protein M513_02240 [Trichuris suis]KFD70087.1 hypothetical protein M514_02240 [Trichuris suis]
MGIPFDHKGITVLLCSHLCRRGAQRAASRYKDAFMVERNPTSTKQQQYGHLAISVRSFRNSSFLELNMRRGTGQPASC